MIPDETLMELIAATLELFGWLDWLLRAFGWLAAVGLVLAVVGVAVIVRHRRAGRSEVRAVVPEGDPDGGEPLGWGADFLEVAEVAEVNR